MVAKSLFLSLSLAALAVAQQAALPLPQSDGVPTPLQEWVAQVDMSKVANAPVGAKCGEAGNDPFCHWTCTECLRTNKTDVATCPKGTWALTFDDGPTEFTPALLDFLKQNNLKVTFFLMGSQVRKLPEFVKRAFADGHELAGHTWSHTPLTTLTNEQIIAELKWTEEVIFQTVGKRIKYFRPPQGDMDDRVRDIAAQLGYKIFQWDVDTNDWKIRTKEITIPQVEANIAKPVSEAGTRQTGVLSLEHDHAKETVDVAIANIPKIIQAGFKPVLASQCIGEASAYRDGSAPATNGTSLAPSASAAVSSAAVSGTVLPSAAASGAASTGAPGASLAAQSGAAKPSSSAQGAKSDANRMSVGIMGLVGAVVASLAF
ncbi:uncharacterized protein VTP21DRAFT_6979 [Calcarisporiella thermophila]|uniref:uncharacterized protein n=1 Tax=Calcarisporiella thermophila TaxID=911321 RepID=UPI003742A073